MAFTPNSSAPNNSALVAITMLSVPAELPYIALFLWSLGSTGWETDPY